METKQKTNWNQIGRVYLTFCKIGAFMFGGGYSMLPLLNRELVDARHWTSEEELLDYFAIAQCTPGVIAINTATFVGKKLGGMPGAAAATLGVITVPVGVVILIASVLMQFWTLPAVQHAFGGVRVAVAALIVSAVVRLVRASVKDWFGLVLCLISFALIGLLHLSPVFAVLLAAAAGILRGRVSK